MQRQCLLLGLRDFARQCKLFDTLVLPIECHACEVWGFSPNVGEAAEVLHRGFVKHLLGVTIPTMNVTVLAELGILLSSLQFHVGVPHKDNQAVTATTNKSCHFHLGCVGLSTTQGSNSFCVI